VCDAGWHSRLAVPLIALWHTCGLVTPHLPCQALVSIRVRVDNPAPTQVLVRAPVVAATRKGVEIYKGCDVVPVSPGCTHHTLYRTSPGLPQAAPSRPRALTAALPRAPVGHGARPRLWVTESTTESSRGL